MKNKTNTEVLISSIRSDNSGRGKKLEEVLPHLDKPWYRYKSLVTLNFFLSACIVTQLTIGYDGGMMNNLQTLSSWQGFFNYPVGARLGTMNNSIAIGALAVNLLISPMAEYMGRKWPIIIGSVFCIVGAVLQGAAPSFGCFVGGRVLIGVGTTISGALAEVYLTESAYPTHRPIIVGLLQAGYPLGSLIGTLVTWGPYNASGLKNSTWSWRIPSLLQGFFPLLQLLIFLFSWESPRYLISKGKVEVARAFFVKYHGNGDAESELVNFQMAEITASIDAEKKRNRVGWKTWISTKPMIHRLCIVCGLAPMIQLCGNAIISYYLSIMLNEIHITDGITKLKINLGISAWGLICDICACFAMRFFGRKTMFMFGFASMCVCYVIYTIIAARISIVDFKSNSLAAGAIAMIFLFQGFYHCVSPVAITYYTEISPFALRGKASQIYSLTGTAIGFFNGYVNPIALVKISWKYYIVYDIWLVCMFLIVFLFFPETKGKSLEEMNEAFGDPIIDDNAVEEYEKNYLSKVATED